MKPGVSGIGGTLEYVLLSITAISDEEDVPDLTFQGE
jgi:hypothetical protein